MASVGVRSVPQQKVLRSVWCGTAKGASVPGGFSMNVESWVGYVVGARRGVGSTSQERSRSYGQALRLTRLRQRKATVHREASL
jgi:hypothetical protein